MVKSHEISEFSFFTTFSCPVKGFPERFRFFFFKLYRKYWFKVDQIEPIIEHLTNIIKVACTAIDVHPI